MESDPIKNEERKVSADYSNWNVGIGRITRCDWLNWIL